MRPLRRYRRQRTLRRSAIRQKVRASEMAVMYLFTRYRFNWDEVDFSVFSTYSMVTGLVAPLVELLNGTSFIAMRSIATKLVPADELGKVNSLFGVCEALMPLAYGPMYSLVYASTMDTVPGTFFLLGGALTAPAVLIFMQMDVHSAQEAREKQPTRYKWNKERGQRADRHPSPPGHPNKRSGEWKAEADEWL
uniref:Solute carrier family 46 member 3 n=1 Tax=Timema genevievae TaxID=629358 RepID=A0A7R9JV68_TIMGE|nr:unnamed protein product [Timema genevievae]